ncbi:hypothetical protein BCR35DRAFT_309574 [Leucosporidium creatinivorum]|uniref:Uncharacterized protein n=1 Tax=Leucosporidium creatinivorum TaxID=106004 RepID=A0A1Y2DEI5_9BASI|nr:hypothetical protein BCR35DRAFT_309574 [Leucosporidium creatinivorum]
MLDPSLTEAEARSLFLTFLYVQYASCAVVLLGFPIAVALTIRYCRRFWARDRPLYRIIVISIMFAGTCYTSVLLAQTVIVARSVRPTSTISNIPVAYSWAYFANRMFMSAAAGTAEPFFLWRATKVTTSQVFKWGGIGWLVVTSMVFMASHALIVRGVVLTGQPWSFEISILECTAYWLVYILIGAPAVVLMRQLARAKSIVMRPSQDRLLHWYQATVKTSLIALIPGIGGAISSCFFSRRAPNFEHFFFFNLYLPTAVISTLYALTSREDPQQRPSGPATTQGSPEVPSFMMHFPPPTTGSRQDWMMEEEDDTRVSAMVERGVEAEKEKEGV